MYLSTGKQKELPNGLYADVAKYRHKVFVDRLGWKLSTDGELEEDQFDNSNTIYVVSHDKKGRISGCARLLPTIKPYLLEEVFPQLLNGILPPKSSDVWELSRFSSIDFNEKGVHKQGSFSSSVTIELLDKCLAIAAEKGAKRIITVSPVGVERLLKFSGFDIHRAGPPMIIDGHPIFACWIEIHAL